MMLNGDAYLLVEKALRPFVARASSEGAFIR
jgi:hypothetical protein